MTDPLAWLDSEPVRTRVYPLVALVIGYLMTRGVMDMDTADFVAAFAALLLGPVATETARQKVSPTAHTPPPPTLQDHD